MAILSASGRRWPRVRITSGGICDAQVFVDDVNVPELRDVKMHIPIDGPPVVALEVLALDFAFEGPAEVILAPVVYPGYELVREDLGNGRTRFTAREVANGDADVP